MILVSNNNDNNVNGQTTDVRRDDRKT